MTGQIKKETRKNKKKKHLKTICLLCWIILPLGIISTIVLDGLGIYILNNERLLIIGACILVMLIPFFSEITVKNISFKKDTNSKK